MVSKDICIIVAMAIYMMLMVYIGISFSSKNKNTDDFYLGGRKLGPFVTAMSAEASDMSSWLLMGLPGVAYLTGMAEAAWTALGLALGTYINWLIVAKRIRVYSVKAGNATTIPEFFANRYRDKSNILTVTAAIIIIIFFIPYTASGFKACGTLFNSLFGLNYTASMLICAAIIVVYTALGGFLAASTTDLIQSVVMTIALITVLIFGINFAGGLTNVLDNAKSVGDYLSLIKTHNVATNEVSNYGILTIVSTMAWGLGYFGMPHILLRFMAIKDTAKLKLSRRVASVWVVISMAAAIFIGIVGYGMTKADPETFALLGTSSESETVIIAIARLISSHGIFAAIIAGIILSGILAATMSTADSQLLAAASSVSQNIIQPFSKKEMSDKKKMIIARCTVVVISIISVFLAINPNSSVFRIVSFAWAGFGASFGPVVLFALFWKRSNAQGAVAGIITGGTMVFLWKFVIAKLGGVFAIYELLPAFIAACIAIVVVSLITPAPSKEITDEFEEVKNAV